MRQIPQALTDGHLQFPSWQRWIGGLVQRLHRAMQRASLRQFQRAASQRVQTLAQQPIGETCMIAAPAMHLTNQMKLTQLQHPAVMTGQRAHPTQIVCHHAPNPRSDLHGQRLDQSRPLAHMFAAWDQHRIQKRRLILVTRFQGHQIQHPRAATKTHPQAIDQQNERPLGDTDNPRLRHEASQQPTKSITEGLRRQSLPASLTPQGLVPEQHPLQEGVGNTMPRTPALLGANAPSPSAQLTSSPASSESVNFGPTTWGFRMQCFHACGVSAFGLQKRLIHQTFGPNLSTELFCLNLNGQSSWAFGCQQSAFSDQPSNFSELNADCHRLIAISH